MSIYPARNTAINLMPRVVAQFSVLSPHILYTPLFFSFEFVTLIFQIIGRSPICFCMGETINEGDKFSVFPMIKYGRHRTIFLKMSAKSDISNKHEIIHEN